LKGKILAPAHIAPYGSWKSPITSDLIVTDAIGLGRPAFDGEELYFTELRPDEQGRIVVIQLLPDGSAQQRTPPGFNVRSRVHEYGGGAWLVHQGTLYFSNYTDQRLYRLEPGEDQPQALTPSDGFRYADGAIDERRGTLYLVREDHTSPGEAVNTLVALDIRPGAPVDSGRVICQGYNFYSTPRLDPAGERIAWLCWNHPNMPWDGTELWVAELAADGSPLNPRQVAGGASESIFQPSWSPDGSLVFVSDRSGWWNLYRWQGGQVEALCPKEAEFGQPQWSFNQSAYGFTSPGEIICTYQLDGFSHLARLDLASGVLGEIACPFNAIWDVRVSAGKVLLLAGSPSQPPSLAVYTTHTGEWQVLRRNFEVAVDPAEFSMPQAIEFPTSGGLTAYAIYYPPHNPDYAAPEGELPPLIVMSHGGPTGATSSSLSYAMQYWTSRGFALVDVNYGGSTGYGRAYRQRLNGNWGVVDVDDCVNAALYLVQQGLVDKQRLAITGGSAGGYTTLCAITFKNVFTAGASHFGIGEMETFIGDTHKFESRYCDSLIGPYPEHKDVYYARSPLNFVDRLNTPIILFQGLDDPVVPPSQSERFYQAALKKGIPTAYLPFEGEQHGFRQATNIKRALEAELYFYSKIFGFDLADAVEPVDIKNLA
jgi:dipeptidyl aminopeptidase/acylaminoacyl peptidase